MALFDMFKKQPYKTKLRRVGQLLTIIGIIGLTGCGKNPEKELISEDGNFVSRQVVALKDYIVNDFNNAANALERAARANTPEHSRKEKKLAHTNLCELQKQMRELIQVESLNEEERRELQLALQELSTMIAELAAELEVEPREL